MTALMYRSNVATPFCVTNTAQQIFDAVNCCIKSPHVKLGRIIGPPGIGKTTALTEFTERTSDVLMVSMSPAHSTMKTSLAWILQKMGCLPPKSTNETYEDVHDLLWSRGVRALIVDEAQESYIGLSNALRCISDSIGVAVIFCGNRRFLSNFGKEKDSFAQIKSRLAVDLRLDKPSLTDVTAVLDLLSIRDQPARKLLLKSSQGDGALRMVHTLVQQASVMAGSAEAIRLSHLQDALAIIGGAR